MTIFSPSNEAFGQDNRTFPNSCLVVELSPVQFIAGWVSPVSVSPEAQFLPNTLRLPTPPSSCPALAPPPPAAVSAAGRLPPYGRRSRYWQPHVPLAASLPTGVALSAGRLPRRSPPLPPPFSAQPPCWRRALPPPPPLAAAPAAGRHERRRPPSLPPSPPLAAVPAAFHPTPLSCNLPRCLPTTRAACRLPLLLAPPPPPPTSPSAAASDTSR